MTHEQKDGTDSRVLSTAVLGIDDMSVREKFDAIEQGFSRRGPLCLPSLVSVGFLRRMLKLFFHQGGRREEDFAFDPLPPTAPLKNEPCSGVSPAMHIKESGAPTIVSEVQSNRDLPYKPLTSELKGAALLRRPATEGSDLER